MKQHVDDKEHPSNPEVPHLKQIFTFLTTWDQIERHLLAKRDEYDRRFPPSAPSTAEQTPEGNVFSSAGGGGAVAEADGCTAALRARLELPIHSRLNRGSTVATLRYLFHHMRCGIYVMVRAGKMRMFVPFVNAAYENAWEGGAPSWVAPGTDGSEGDLGQDVSGYYDDKVRKGNRAENVIPEVKGWWANGNIMCNEHCPPGQTESQYWGDQLLVPLRDMLHELCAARKVPDCEFFINKRDYPHLKVHVGPSGDCVPVEPYGFIVDKDDCDPLADTPLAREGAHATYAPVCSFYCGAPDRFADLPFPTSEDWEAATGLVFPPSFKREPDRKTGTLEFDSPRDLFTESNFRKFDVAWEAKRPTALFRGTATGGGVTEASNQRLAVAGLSCAWAKDEGRAGLLDAAITGWNRRDKKVAGSPMSHLDPRAFPFTGGKKNYVPIYEQSAYKYLLYIDGHCAACRYAFMMRLGSVILKVESRGVADRMWYFPLLRPWADHVPVAPDLSDLEAKIRWCRDHDAECRAIAANAAALYARFVAKKGLLDYLEVLTHEIAGRFEHPPRWWRPPAPPPSPPSAPHGASHGRPCDPHTSKHCARCAEERAEEEDAALADEARRRVVADAAGAEQGEVGAQGAAKKKRRVLKKQTTRDPK